MIRFQSRVGNIVSMVESLWMLAGVEVVERESQLWAGPQEEEAEEWQQALVVALVVLCRGGAGGGGMNAGIGWGAFAAAEKCGMRGGGPGGVVPGLPAGAAGLTVRRIETSSCAMNDHESSIQN